MSTTYPTADTFPLPFPSPAEPPAGEAPTAVDLETLRRQATMILSAMDAAARERGPACGRYERREGPQRIRLRQEARLTLHADDGDTPPRALFLRDVEPRAAGFIAPERLPLGYGGVLECRDLEGKTTRVGVTIVRCRACPGGWYEGAAYFHQPRPSFGPTLSELA